MKRIYAGIAALAVLLSGMTLVAPSVASAATGDNVSQSSATEASQDLGAHKTATADQDDDTATVKGDVDDVLTANAGFVGKSKKVKVCKAYAEKLEQQAPPRDPHALCKGKLKVKLVGKITASCPTGYFGGSVMLFVKLTESVKARAFAKSIASGRVRTWARFKIRDLAKIRGKTRIECVRIPDEPEPETPVYSCDQLQVSKSATGRTVTIDAFRVTAQNGAVYNDAVIEWGDATPALTTASPVGRSHTFGSDGSFTIRLTARFTVDGSVVTASGPNCTQTVTFTPDDACPYIPGEQPPGYDCTPPDKPVIVDLKRVNDGNPGWETPACAKADFAGTHGGTLTFSFESGGITGTNPVTVADMQEGCVNLVFPTDPGTYTYKVTATDSVTHASVTKESQPFQVWSSPPAPEIQGK